MEKVIIMTLFSFISISALASWREGGGGDEIGLQFRASLNKALSEIKAKDSETYKHFTDNNIDAVMKSAKVLVVDHALDVKVKDLIQTSVAVNTPSSTTIMINRVRWAGIQNETLKESIALHEVLSLIGLEQTGYYPFSSNYLASKGGLLTDLSKSLAVDRVKQIAAQSPNATPYEVLKQLFEEASAPATVNDFDVNTAPNTAHPMKCVAVTPDSKNKTIEMFLGRIYVTLKEGTPDRGPLFPSTPSKKAWVVIGTMTETELADFRDQGQFVSMEIQQNPGELIEWQNNNGTVLWALSIRKNNNFIAFKNSNNSKLVYGYCYRN